MKILSLFVSLVLNFASSNEIPRHLARSEILMWLLISPAREINNSFCLPFKFWGLAEVPNIILQYNIIHLYSLHQIRQNLAIYMPAVTDGCSLTLSTIMHLSMSVPTTPLMYGEGWGFEGD